MQTSRIGAPRGEQRDVLDEVEERLLAPLDVVEDDHERRRLLLEQLAERPGDLLGGRRLLALAEQRADRRRGGPVGRQRVELLEHLDHRPVGDPLAVGEAAAADDPSVDRGRATSATSRDLPTPASPTTVTSSQRCSARARCHACGAARARARGRRSAPRARAPAPRARADSRYAATGSALPFSSSGSTGSASTASRTSSSVGSPISISPGSRRLLEPRGDVDRVAGREPLLGAGDDLAGVHADPALDAELRASASAHLHRRPAGAQRVVLVQPRHAEDGHHRVADELLHRAAVRLDDRLHPLEVAGEQRLSASGSTDSPSAVEPTTSQNSTVTTFAAPTPSPHRLCTALAQNLNTSAAWYAPFCCYRGNGAHWYGFRARRRSRRRPATASTPARAAFSSSPTPVHQQRRRPRHRPAGDERRQPPLTARAAPPPLRPSAAGTASTRSSGTSRPTASTASSCSVTPACRPTRTSRVRTAGSSTARCSTSTTCTPRVGTAA